MNAVEQRKKAKEFAEFWKDKGYEKGESQTFWLSLLQDVLGVANPKEFIKFEESLHIDKATGFIDGFIPTTKVMIEQKSIDKDLRKAIKQSDGSLLNPFQQAKRYSSELPYDDRPRWIVTCNFKSFLIYDMNNPNGEPEELLLKDLPKEYYRLEFLVNTKDEHIKKENEVSFKAGELVGILYDAFSKQYQDLNNTESQRSLNELCVRIVFCLYAEDADLFGRHSAFHDYLAKYDDLNLMRENLIKLFKVLDTPMDKRDKYLEDDLAQFPYVNGGLFSNENIEIPRFTEEIRNILLTKASDNFDWSEISPTIFGAVFESTLNPETRRAGGMHYTSIENIHKVIDPLFLDDLRDELNKALEYKNEKTRNEALDDFQNHLSSLSFLDPACGSGNFLTETYLSLRRLENEAIEAKQHGQSQLDLGDVIKVNINQFYGIEINDFAVTVAKTALWIAESQMVKSTEEIVHTKIDFLPLKTYTNIVEGNALRIDWNDVLPNTKCNYIMGNPPFVGQSLKTPEQVNDVILIFGKGSPETKMDYVTCWYKKALDFMKNTKIIAAFVSTNSICQGESVPTFWKRLIDEGAEIQFAHSNFIWKNESSKQASVTCVIVGFSAFHNTNEKKIYYDSGYTKATHINAYLMNSPDIWIINRKNIAPKNFPKMTKGSEAVDGKNLFLTPVEASELSKKYPQLKKYIKKFIGGDEFLNCKQNSISRYCFWFKGGNPTDYVGINEITNRLRRIKEIRNNSSADRIRNRADFPYEFCQIRQPKSDYLIIPQTTTSARRYIPIGFISVDIIVGNSCYIIPTTDKYIMGILISNVHMAWMRIIAGRMGMGYRYSPSVYNNFPWPTPTDEQKKLIEATAQNILNVRAKYPDSSLADLYDELTMPSDLRTAHQQNDKAVMKAYGFDIKMTESECVAKLMEMYQDLVNKQDK